MKAHRADAIFVAALALICGLSAFVGLAQPLGSFAWDVFFLLDNSSRVIQGQIPYRDFSSAWGPLTYLIYAVGLLFSGMRPVGLGYANAMFGAAIAAWTFAIARTRWSTAAACALGIFAILLIAAPFPLGFAPLDFSYAMAYNRYGYALFGIILVECAAEALTPRAWTRQRAVGAISTGIALGLLAFLKISYALVAISFIATFMLSGGAERARRLAGLASGFAIVSLLALFYLRFDVADMLRDLAMAASARRLVLHPSQLLQLQIVAENAPLLLLAGLVYASKTGIFQDRAARFRAALLAAVTVAAGGLLLITNWQPSGFPLNAYAAVVLATAAAYRPSVAGESLQWSRLTMGLLLALCFVPLSVSNAMSLAGAALQRLWPTRPRIAMALPERGTSMFFSPWVGSPETSGAQYVAALNDGMELLRQHLGSGEGVLTFDMFDPFNYLLDRPSPRGGFAAAAYDYVYSDAAYPTAERFFADTQYVLVSKYEAASMSREEELNNIVAPMRIYGSALRANFTIVAETDRWVLWRRRSP